MKCLANDIVSLGPWWGKEEQIVSMHVPLMTGIEVSHNLNIPTSEDNLVLGVQADGNGSIPLALSGLEP